MINNIEQFWNVLYQREISSKEELIREIIRVKLTENYILNNLLSNEDEMIWSDRLYEIMKESTEEEIGYFPGDRDLFKEIFNIGKSIDLQEFAVKTYKNDRMGTIIAPVHLTNYMVDIIEDSEAKSVLITDAEKSLVGLRNVVKSFKNITFTLTSENKLMYLLLKLIFIQSENVSVIHQSVYKRLLLKQNLDLILCLPTFGMKFDVEEISNKYMTRESEGIAVENLLELIDEKGMIYIIVPARLTFSGGSFERLRNYITSEYSIKSIYTLPEGTFRPYTGIKTYMLGITNKTVQQIKLGNLELDNEEFILTDEKEISINDFNKYSDWRVELFLSENQDEVQKFKTSKTEKVKLKDVAEIFRGKSIMKKDIQPGKIHVLNISNIEDGQIIYDDMDTIDEEERKIKRYELLEKDLVITCRGTINKVAVYEGSNKAIIASANIIVIRFKGDILSDYVKIFLESPIGTTIIRSFQRGTTVMNINPKDIGEMEIPIALLDKQEQIVKQYIKERELYVETIRNAERRWISHKTEIYEKLLK
ncbi:MAG: restriction endonuclease subunit S [Clostridia bacterium]|nr:restriction endonuclease subunit S [Clostridia bacterium]